MPIHPRPPANLRLPASKPATAPAENPSAGLAGGPQIALVDRRRAREMDTAQRSGDETGQWSAFAGRVLIAVGLLGLALTLAVVLIAGLLGSRRTR